MAKNKPEETRTKIDDINESLSSVEQKVQNNQKAIMWGAIILAAIACLVLIYVYAIRRPGIQSANDAIGQADMELALGNDSIALMQYEQIADEYGYDAGNRANLNAAILYYQKGDWQKALDYVKNYSSSDDVIGASAKALEGDCYVNLGELEKAVKCFASAAKISDKNPLYTPLFLMKEATVQRELKNYAAEAALYQEILDNYPEYQAATQIDVEKYLARAKAQMAE